MSAITQLLTPLRIVLNGLASVVGAGARILWTLFKARHGR